jgi:serine/threonine protein kinase
MSPELHQRIRRIFDEALERPESERLQFLKEICGADDEAFQSVARLLAARGESSFLDRTSPSTRRFGRYVISRELGRGAMGIVYEAVDPVIGRPVAVKIIHLGSLAQPDDAGFMRERLFREARSAGGLSHPGIVTIFDVGQESGVAFIAMEYVDGPTLQQMLASSRRFDSGKAIDILRQAAEALDYAHRNGVIHRDVKPANIMVHEGARVKITDFGIAKVLAGAEHTRTGMVLGTPSHMSPEQIGGKPLDGRSDQFSLAAVAFQLLTGTEPFQADSLAALLQKILYEPRLSARALNPALPPGVDKVLQRGLEKTLALRYATCADFVNALEEAIEGPPALQLPPRIRPPLVEALAAGTDPPSPDTVAHIGGFRSRIPAFGAAIGVTAVFAVLFFYFSGILPPRQTAPANAPSAPKTPPTMTDIKPVAAAAQRDFPPNDSVKPADSVKPPRDDKPARARQVYEEAIKYRNAEQGARALDLFRQAASLGEVRAMVELGETFMNDGDGSSADYPEALRWLSKAAEAGDSSGMVDLGGMYLLGNGVDEDFGTAVRWFSKAAEAGNPAAMYNLGTMYENGQGVIEDRDKAEQLYGKAAHLGNKEAMKRLAELAK